MHCLQTRPALFMGASYLKHHDKPRPFMADFYLAHHVKFHARSCLILVDLISRTLRISLAVHRARLSHIEGWGFFACITTHMFHVHYHQHTSNPAGKSQQRPAQRCLTHMGSYCKLNWAPALRKWQQVASGCTPRCAEDLVAAAYSVRSTKTSTIRAQP